VVSGEVQWQDKICGVRITDKSKGGDSYAYRFEIWTDFNREGGNDDGAAPKIKEYLKNVLIELEFPDAASQEIGFHPHS
jgi:hypothetical protein